MKKILALLICVACLCLSACGISNEENILEKIRDVNLDSALQENGKTVAFRADIYDAEGRIDSSNAYLDPDRVVYECADRVEINEKGDIYGFDNIEKNFYRYLFLDDSDKDYVVEVTGYIWNPDEMVLSATKKDGDLVVRARDGGEDNLANMAGMMTYYGYDVPETFTIINEYILDSKTYEIKCYNVDANFGDEDFLLVENKRVDNPEVYEVDSKLIDAVNAENSRVVYEFYCWRCKQGPFDRSQTKNCYECGWDICPKCGACVGGCSRMKVERPSSTTEPIKNQNDDSELGIMIMVLLIAGVFIIIRVKDSDWYTSRDYRKKSKIYDSSGFNCYGVHRNGTRYDENGYNQDGFDANGYDANGYNQDGFDANGYDANGYDKSGYNKSGYDRRGFDRFGYGKSGYNRQGYDKFGYNRAGYNQQGYNKLGYKRDGFDANGYDSNGYNKAGFDVNGYDSKGFDKDGYNKDGINALGKKRPNKYIEINSKQISKKDLKPDKFGNITCPYCKSKVTTYWKRCPKCDEPFDFLKD